MDEFETEMTTKGTSGTRSRSLDEVRSELLADDEVRTEYERLEPFEQLAIFVIRRRRTLGLTQAQLAERMGTSHSAVSRIESGQHKTSFDTLVKLGEAFGERFVFGFESGGAKRPVRELISVR